MKIMEFNHIYATALGHEYRILSIWERIKGKCLHSPIQKKKKEKAGAGKKIPNQQTKYSSPKVWCYWLETGRGDFKTEGGSSLFGV